MASDELTRLLAENLTEAVGRTAAALAEHEAHGKGNDPLARQERDRQSRALLSDAVTRAQDAADMNARRKFELVVHDTALEGGSTFPPTEDVIHEPARDDATWALQRANDELYLLSKILGRPASKTKYFEQLQSRGMLGKALSTTTASGGAEWVPSGFSAQIAETVQAELRLAGLHDRITMPTKTYTFPVEGNDPSAYLAFENNDIAASDATTRNVVLDAMTIAARQLFSAELTEDSVVPILPRLQTQIARAIARGIENAMVNGDTAATHMDSDVTVASDVRKAWMGYRAKAIADPAANIDCASMEAEALLSIKKLMGRYALDPAECSWVVGISAFNQLLMLKDHAGTPYVTTVDKYGAQATMLTGELGRLFGIPVVVSAACREDLNASGHYDGTTRTKTALFLVNRRAFVLGDRRRITLETQKNIGNQQLTLVATWRGAFGHCFGHEISAGMGYNITA